MCPILWRFVTIEQKNEWECLVSDEKIRVFWLAEEDSILPEIMCQIIWFLQISSYTSLASAHPLASWSPFSTVSKYNSQRRLISVWGSMAASLSPRQCWQKNCSNYGEGTCWGLRIFPNFLHSNLVRLKLVVLCILFIKESWWKVLNTKTKM